MTVKPIVRNHINAYMKLVQRLPIEPSRAQTRPTHGAGFSEQATIASTQNAPTQARSNRSAKEHAFHASSAALIPALLHRLVPGVHACAQVRHIDDRLHETKQ